LNEKLESLTEREKEYKLIKDQKEFPYLDDLTEKQIEKLKRSKLVYVDPGKIRLYTMIDNEDNVFKYSNKTYMRKRKLCNDKINKLREKYKICDIEKELCQFNSKSCYYDNFSKYLLKKNECNKLLLQNYNDIKFRKYRWYSYMEKQKEMSSLVSSIKKKYGENSKLIMGDWSPSKQMRGHVSTPMIGLKRKLRKDFEIINLDEYNTSKLHHVSEEKTENIVLPIEVIKKDKEGKIMKDANGKEITEFVPRKIHSVLISKMSNGRMGCINRDINSVKNMRKIVSHWLKTGERLEKYKRLNVNTRSVVVKEKQPKKPKRFTGAQGCPGKGRPKKITKNCVQPL
jgi:hemerythrin